ncbi:MAG: odorant receptor, partial [Lachnospiraceae bacterium]|nr:odorant receptor [Lachnospiraceae bacterium]
MKNWKKSYEIIYIGMFLFAVFMIVWAICQYKGTKLKDDFFDNGSAYDTGWHTKDGQEVDLNHLNRTEGTKEREAFSIYNTIPQEIQVGDALCFRSKNMFFQVYIDGNLQYDPYVPEHPAYTNTYGTDWNYVGIPIEAAGCEVEVRITYVDSHSRACMDYIS